MRVAVVGLGAMGRRHASSMQRQKNPVTVAFLDPFAGNEPHMLQLDSIKSLIAWAPDYAIVSTMNSLHSSVASELLSSGIATLLEKPATESCTELESLLEIEREYGTPLWLGYVERFNPSILRLKTMMSGSELGSLKSIYISRLSWIRRERWGSDVALDLMSHDIDLVHFLTGQRLADWRLHRGKVQERAVHAELLGETNSGVTVTLRSSWLHPEKVRQVEVVCEHGVITCNLLTMELSVFRPELTMENDTVASVTRGHHPYAKIGVPVETKEPLVEMHSQIMGQIAGLVSATSSHIARGSDGLAVHRVLSGVHHE